MKSYHFQPVTLLKPFIKTFMIVESGDGLQNNVLPDTTMTMAFRLRGAITHDANSNAIFPSSFVSGIRRSSLTVSYARDTLNVLVIFHEGAASASFNTAASIGCVLLNIQWCRRSPPSPMPLLTL